MAYVEVKDCVKRYQMGETVVLANAGINFSVEKGEFVIILGPSGAGKSTLLNILGGMDVADEGEILVDGKDIARLDERARTDYRRYDVGFVFQFYNLLPNLTVRENVELAAQIVKGAQDPVKVLEQVGLLERLDNFPAQLSGGEQQRVAIARALAKNPKLLLCDEPTGALDSQTGRQVLGLLLDACRKGGATVLVITHNRALAPLADRVIEIADAKVRATEINSHPKGLEEIDW